MKEKTVFRTVQYSTNKDEKKLSEAVIPVPHVVYIYMIYFSVGSPLTDRQPYSLCCGIKRSYLSPKTF